MVVPAGSQYRFVAESYQVNVRLVVGSQPAEASLKSAPEQH